MFTQCLWIGASDGFILHTLKSSLASPWCYLMALVTILARGKEVGVGVVSKYMCPFLVWEIILAIGNHILGNPLSPLIIQKGKPQAGFPFFSLLMGKVPLFIGL